MNTPERPDAPATEAGLKRTERLAWLGFMLFFVVVLAIYIARGIGLERDVTTANRELLETQLRLSQYTRDEVPRPPQLGLTHAQLQLLQRRGLARPEVQLEESLLRQAGLLPAAAGADAAFVPGAVHVLSDRWVMAAFRGDAGRGWMLAEYEVVHGNILWQVVDAYLD
jgi:hypothetical protein